MKKLFLFISGMLLILGIASTGQAYILWDLIDDNQEFTVGDKRFDDWEANLIIPPFDWLDPDNVEFPTLLQAITVTGDDSDPLNPKITFQGNNAIAVSGFDWLDFEISFSVEALNDGWFIHDNSLEMGGYYFGGLGGVITIAEQVFPFDPSFNPLDPPLEDLLVQKWVNVDSDPFVDPSFIILEDHKEFDPPLKKISVIKDISLVGVGEGLDDVVRLDSFTQGFSQVQAVVPEPTSMLLFGSGLIGLAGFRRRSKK